MKLINKVLAVSAISCGIINNKVFLDLDYYEDSNADADANFVFNNQGEIINSLPTFSRDVLEIEVVPKFMPTVFSKFGYFPLYVFLLMIALCDKFKSFPLLKRKKKVKSQP